MMFDIDLSSIKADKMKVLQPTSIFAQMPWKALDLSLIQHLNFDQDLTERAEQAIKQLKNGIIDGLDELDVLAMLISFHEIWQDNQQTKKICENLAMSALKTNNQNTLRLILMLCFHYHRNTKFYDNLSYGNILKHLIQCFKNSQDRLLQGLWKDKSYGQAVVAVLNDQSVELAKIAIEKRQHISQLFKIYRLSVKKEIKYQAEQDWLNRYFNLDEQSLKLLNPAITIWLNRESNDIDYAIKTTQFIFDHHYFPKNIPQELPILEQKTKKFVHIYEWLKKWSKNQQYMNALNRLDLKYVKILRCWLGTGNYYQLEQLVREIAMLHGEFHPNKGSISLHRYIFWTNYQQHILDYYLLIPQNRQELYRNIMEKANSKLMTTLIQEEMNVPVVLLKFDKYYVIQPLVLTASQVDLIMTEEIEKIENGLANHLFNSSILSTVEPCLIHDHYNLWQNDMALTLRDYFDIQMSNPNQFVITTTRVISFPAKNVQHADRLEVINKWYQSANSTDSRYIYRKAKNMLNKYALSYLQRMIRHASIDKSWSITQDGKIVGDIENDV